jgi:Na+/melibiose symporter-like transporter
MGAFHAFNNFTLTLWLSAFTSSYLVLGLMGNTRSLEGAFVSPLTGAWSDRVWAGWLGRRRPFILIGGLLSAFFVAATPSISRWPLPWLAAAWLPELAPGLVMAVVAIFLFTVAFNTMDDLHKALLADVTTPDQRNRLSALATTTELLAQVGLLVLAYLLWHSSVPDTAFTITAGVLTFGVLVTVLGVKEPAPAVWQAERQAEAGAADPPLSIGAALGHYRPAVVLCLIQFVYWSGVNAVMPLISVYCRDILGASIGEAQLLPALMLLSSTLLAIPMGKLGDQLGKRRVLGVGYAVIASAALGGLVITTREQGAVVFLLAGVGNAAMAVLQIPLLADLVPRQHMGTATGALAASGSVAAPLASLAAGGLSDLYGPRAIFAMMAALVFAALLLLPATRLPRPAEAGSSIGRSTTSEESDDVRTPV